MSQEITLARPYAKAAFQLAVDAGALQSWSTMLNTLAAVVRDEKVASYLATPSVSAELQAHTLNVLLGDALNEEARNFIALLTRNKRVTLLPDIAQLFDELKAERERTVDVEVVSAFDMNDEAKARLTQALKSRLGREVELNTRVDRSLIGGLVVRAGDLVIDGSVRGKLNKLADSMTA